MCVRGINYQARNNNGNVYVLGVSTTKPGITTAMYMCVRSINYQAMNNNGNVYVC
jgi:hypothetical protein